MKTTKYIDVNQSWTKTVRFQGGLQSHVSVQHIVE